MRNMMRAAFCWAGLLCCAGSFAPMAIAQDADAEIKAVLNKQAEDWNRGDLDAFATGYKNSRDFLFVGPSVKHGYAEMLANYKAHYPSREAMGQLTFSHLDVHALDAQIATTTGDFQLTRSPQGGGNASGYFLLVLKKTAAGWKIVCDDTTAQAAKHE